MKNSPQNSKEKFWNDHIHRFRRSGQSRREYCLAENLSYWTFGDWQKKIEKNPDEKMVKISRRVHSSNNNRQSFIDIVVAEKVSIRIAQGFDGELLRDLLNELGVAL